MICRHGHRLEGNNRIVNAQGRVVCRTCKRAASTRDYRKHREQRLAEQCALYAADGEARRVRQRAYHAMHPEIARRQKLTRRARKRNQFIEVVDPQALYEMHGGMCGICKEFIEGDFHVDHILPLSKGGMHGYVNCQPAHPLCNLRKGARTDEVLR